MITALFPFLLAGLAGSLHCIGMCGPILGTFSQVIRSHEVRIVSAKTRLSRFLDYSFYHLGRIWTYALLGALAGGVGQIVGMGGIALGIRQGMGILVGVATMVGGFLLLGWIGSPGRWEVGFLANPVIKRSTASLFRRRGFLPKFLLGILMGFLPCGLLYAALVMAAAFQNPLWGALAMILFGIGTLPSLSTVLLVSNSLPVSWRGQGTRIAGVVILLTGIWIAGRSAISPETCPYCRLGMAPYSSEQQPDPVNHPNP